LIEIGSKTAEKNSAQTNNQTDRHYENNGHLAVNQIYKTIDNPLDQHDTKISKLSGIPSYARVTLYNRFRLTA